MKDDVRWKQRFSNFSKAYLFPDGHAWLDALSKRNLMAHTYDEKNAAEAVTLIRTDYAALIRNLFAAMDRLK